MAAVLEDDNEKTPLNKARLEAEQGLKVVVVGDTHVGKTAVVKCFCENVFGRDYKMTIGVDVTTKQVRVDGKALLLCVWDVAGQDMFARTREVFYKGSNAVIIVYDITKRRTFKNIRNWLDEINLFNERFPLFLVGNKLDCTAARVVSTEEGEQLADELGATFFETSAQAKINVVPLFIAVTRELLVTHPGAKVDPRLPVIDLDQVNASGEVATVLIQRKSDSCCECCPCTIL